MYFGYLSLASYPFIAAGFWIVMAVSAGFCMVYLVGPRAGKRAAQKWVDACVGVLVAASLADIAWAVLSGQWAAFMMVFGTGPLFEMFMLGVLLVGSMWFLAVRYTQGLKD